MGYIKALTQNHLNGSYWESLVWYLKSLESNVYTPEEVKKIKDINSELKSFFLYHKEEFDFIEIKDSKLLLYEIKSKNVRYNKDDRKFDISQKEIDFFEECLNREITVKLGFVWYEDLTNFHLKVFDYRGLRIVGNYRKKIYLHRELKYSPKYVRYERVENILKDEEIIKRFILGLGEGEIVWGDELAKSLNLDSKLVKVILEKFAAERLLGCTTGYKKRFWRK